jgi:hypothetical protein
MEDLMEIVAASFARHGIECPFVDPRLVERRASSPVQAERGAVAAGNAVYAGAQTTTLIEPTALPEHNYRKSLQGDPAP